MTRFYSVDWGTTRLRARLVDRNPLRIIAEQQSDEGIATVDAAWQAAGAPGKRLEFFTERLAAVLGKLSPDRNRERFDAPVVVSGMASSSIGMQELPYAKAPIARRGKDLLTSTLDQLAAFPAGLVLVSGVATQDDVIRGEETEWLGLIEQDFSSGLYLLPGTHSKHLTTANGSLTGIRTFLTGELFDVLSQHSLLAGSTATDEPVAPTDTFLDAVREASSSAATSLLGQLFSVRARALLAAATPREGAQRLSGLLIGSELATLPRSTDAEPLILCGSDSLQPLYAAALEEIGIPHTPVGRRQQSEAVPHAHAGLLQQIRDGSPASS